jgi:cytoskeletal protein CcmA (bactofilin family)
MADKIVTPDHSPNSSVASGKNALNADVEIKGMLKFSGELAFDGKLDGEVQTEGVLNVGENANITGNINANAVVARGKINGNIIAKDKVEVKARTELFGDIRAAKLVIEEGVTFVGKIDVNPNKVAPTSTPRGGDGMPRVETPRPPEVTKPGGR